MNIYIMNTDFEIVDVCDTYKSIIWTPRYYDIGDFELYLPCTAKNFEAFQAGRMLVRDEDITCPLGISGDRFDNVMIVEHVETSTDIEEGDYLIVSGRDLKSIFTRRVIWPQTSYTSKAVSDIIYSLLTDLTASTETTEPYASRCIPNMTIDKTFSISEQIDKQFTGDVLSDAIIDLLKTYKTGWRVYIEGGKYVVQLYAGADRSYDQTENPYVVFSEDYDDLITSNYATDITDYKNFVYVAGEGEGTDRKYSSATDGTDVTGLNRRELFADARNTSSNTTETTTDAEYLAMLAQEGAEDLTENAATLTISGELDFTTTYTLNDDVCLGDQVQLITPYGIAGKVRITEIIESEDTGGTTIQATFESE